MVTFPRLGRPDLVAGERIGLRPGPQAGEATIGVPVGLPFFVDATIAPEYLVSDQPAIGLRAYGTALEAGSQVTFAVDSDSLGLHVNGLHAAAFETETVRFPKLTVGSHQVTITATTGAGASARRDILTRTFTVVAIAAGHDARTVRRTDRRHAPRGRRRPGPGRRIRRRGRPIPADPARRDRGGFRPTRADPRGSDRRVPGDGSLRPRRRGSDGRLRWRHLPDRGWRALDPAVFEQQPRGLGVGGPRRARVLRSRRSRVVPVGDRRRRASRHANGGCSRWRVSPGSMSPCCP